MQTVDPRFDRLCEGLAPQIARQVPWEVENRRGDLNLEKDGSQHRKYHSLFDDLLN